MDKQALQKDFLNKILLKETDLNEYSKVYPQITDGAFEKTIYELCDSKLEYVRNRAVTLQKLYNPNLKYQLGRRNLRSFLETIIPIVKKQQHFDLILGTGNSGSLMVFLTGLVYTRLDLNLPPAMTIPIVRYRDEEKTIPFDNTILLPEIHATIKELKVKTISEVLFVDDDIEKGSSLKAAMELILKYKGSKNDTSPTKCTILAEDQGIMAGVFDQSIDIKFIPYAHGIDEMTNAIMYCLDKEITQPIIDAMPDIAEEQPRIAINILLDIPIKKHTTLSEKPEFTDEYAIRIRKELKNFNQLKEKALYFLDAYIEEVLSQ